MKETLQSFILFCFGVLLFLLKVNLFLLSQMQHALFCSIYQLDYLVYGFLGVGPQILLYNIPLKLPSSCPIVIMFVTVSVLTHFLNVPRLSFTLKVFLLYKDLLHQRNLPYINQSPLFPCYQLCYLFIQRMFTL